MKKKYIKISGMTCNNCKQKIISNLKQLPWIKEIHVFIDKNLAVVKYLEDQADFQEVARIIIDLGYNTNLDLMFDNEKDFKNAKIIQIYRFLKIIGGIFFVYLFFKIVFGFDFLNSIPEIDSSISYPLLFVIGMMTSIHCVGMCGAFNLAASFGVKVKNPLKRPLLYNLGRVLSYTITGGLAGLLGSILAPSLKFQGILVGLASVFMLVMGLSMLGIMSNKIMNILPKNLKISKIRSSSPFIIGLLNGLMPCGPLQAMQIYAISTASFFLGAYSMLLFALGTVPLMFIVGFVFNFVKGKRVFQMQRISAALVILLALVMFNRSLGYLGINLFNNNSEAQIAQIMDGYQYVEVDVEGNSYEKIYVQKGMLVHLNLKVESGDLNGCNNPIIIPKYSIEKRMSIGDNYLYFTPEKTGTISYSCWMSMIRSQIIVVDDINNINK